MRRLGREVCHGEKVNETGRKSVITWKNTFIVERLSTLFSENTGHARI